LKGLDDGAGQLVQLIGRAKEFGLEPENYHYNTINNLISAYEKKAGNLNRVLMDFNIEILLSDAAFRMMFNLHSGYQHVDSAFLTELSANFAQVLKKGISENNIPGSILSVEPQFIEYQNLRHAVTAFISANPVNKHAAGFQDSVTSNATDSLYWYRILALNLDRLRKRKYTDNRMLYVNIPSYSLRIFEHNRLADTFRVIVGSPSSPTPLLSAKMETVVANPVWYVPRSIAIDEILPKLKKDSNYLERNGFCVLDRNFRPVDARSVRMENINPADFDYTFRQKRGEDNSLGKVKFLFSNPYSVYLHDTPGKALFTKEKRALSHGCIRIQNPERLANYILHEINSDTTRFEYLMEKGLHHEFKLNSPLAIHITYITCEAAPDGDLTFYNDIYGIDKMELEVLAAFMNVN
jgi:murein L,D-transpeptidase YcbB/YkuD